jgi:tRNA (adenine57-N1/adenine58-N1)-methyltransferase
MTDKKIIMLKSGKKYTAVDGQDYHCSFGVIKKEDIEKGFGKTNTDVSFNIFEPTFIDVYEKIKRLAQIIPLKDIGTIIANTGINKNSIVIESGSGSGGLTCVLANVCKKVYSYDIKKAHLDISQKNIKKLGFDNVKFNLQNIEEDFVLDDNELADLAVLDLPQPWNAIDSTVKN